MEDIVVIGSGVSGSTVFTELKKAFPEKKIRLIEKGNDYHYFSEGDNIEVVYADALGGTGVFSVANALRIDLPEFGISKNDEIYETIENELNVSNSPDDFLGENSKKLLKMDFLKTPKFIDFNTCKRCGLCAHSPCDSKWTPCRLLKNFGKEVVTNAVVLRLSKINDIFSIMALNRESGEIMVIQSKKVVISAGGINSPRILKTISDNEHIGKNLFLDTFVTVGGVLKNSNLNSEIPMCVYKKYNEFILATHYSELLFNRISEFEKIDKKDIFGFMVKIPDDSNGLVLEDSVVKEMSAKDTQKLSEGVSKASKYLYDLGIENIYSTVPRGSHPGGTCAINKVVDKNLETEIENLYVCDASVLDKAPGAPPILGLIAISKKFSENLKNSF